MKTIIKNALVYSGLNEEPRRVDVAFEGNIITGVSADITDDSARVIDANGLMLTPGFIDPHASTGFGYFFENYAEHKLFQGITTEIIGNCGTSPAPIGQHLEDTMRGLADKLGFNYNWSGLAEYNSKIEANLQFNFATLIGHSTLRHSFVKDWNKTEQSELEQMKSALALAMEEGALGLSTGLIYAPGCFAETNEIVELAKVAKAYGGLYASHIRNERDKLEDAVAEALHIGEAANIRVLVSHLKAAEKRNWGKIPHILDTIEKYNTNGNGEAAVDVYPYTAVSTKLRAFVPHHFLSQGIAALPDALKASSAKSEINAYAKERGYDLSQMLIISEDVPAYAGKTVAQICDEFSEDTATVFVNILQSNPEAWIVYHCISEDDMTAALAYKRAMVCTDSWSHPINSPVIIGKPHPRSYGAFTEFIERMVIKTNLLSWQEAIYKMTAMPADYFGLKNRGQIAVGYNADLVLFEQNEIKANATYVNPKSLSSGVVHSFVNGVQMIENGKLTPDLAGKFLPLAKASA